MSKVKAISTVKATGHLTFKGVKVDVVGIEKSGIFKTTFVKLAVKNDKGVDEITTLRVGDSLTLDLNLNVVP